jgi:hypothetical protein
MSHIIGRGRRAGETYPSPPNAALGASRNRNVAVPTSLTSFTPATTPSVSLIAALLYTPRVSGVIQATALLDLINGAAPETYAMAIAVATGTNLSVTGGESTSDGWVIGSTTPPVIGGTGVAILGELGTSVVALAAAGSQGDLAVAAAIFSQSLQIGVPVVIEVLITELGGGNALAGIAFTSLSAIELS